MCESCPELIAHTIDYSRAEQVHIIIPRDCNQSFRLFGGQLMEWVDIVAAVVARRHSAAEVTTAAIDRLDFLAPAKLNDIVVLQGRLVYVGHTSMLVCVETFVEDSECTTITRTLVNRAYVTLVALDRDKRPMAVPPLILLTDAERADFASGKIRRDESRKMTQQRSI